MKNIEDNVIALYDGGWRPEDHDQMMSEYDMTKDEADDICKTMQEMIDEGRLI